MSPGERIQQLLAKRPGLKIQQIADELAMDRPEVMSALHALEGEVYQDNGYRWWTKNTPTAPGGTSPAPRTFLSGLCRYYLECLARESGSGVSIPSHSPGEYVELREMPFGPLRNAAWAGDRAIKKLVQKVRREQGQLTLYVGYAVRVRVISGRHEEERRLEPILLYPVDEVLEEHMMHLRPANGVPLFNMEVLKSLPSADSGNMIDEAIHLSEELGLANLEEELPEWDEIILRLQRCRPDWKWREDLSPYEMSHGAPISELQTQGIYNRAILFAGTRSPFTYGLEVELRKLMMLDDAALRGTALGQWLQGETAATAAPVEDRPILEVLPLNSEQRQAVVQGLSAPLTVVTGPPGTGKSQVVTSLLANMAWQETSVLFSSKNNHAVDVVEARTNDLGPYPLLLRLGKEDHQARVAQNLSSGLAETSNAGAAARFDWLEKAHRQDCERFAQVQRDIAAMMELRNTVDELERAAEPARPIFGAERFAALRSADVTAIRQRVDQFGTLLEELREPAGSSVGRFLRDPKPRRVEKAAEAAEALSRDAELLGVAPPSGELDWDRFHVDVSDRLAWAERVHTYGSALGRLQAGSTLEQLAQDLTRISDESAHTSLELWQAWLRLWPSRWSPEKRKLLSEYVSLLQMISGGDRYDEGAGRRVFRRYYSLFPKVTRILPCWAVTTLSARGRLPFEPAIFDLVVIDEASQCDIRLRPAPALPCPPRDDHRRSAAIETRKHHGAATGPAAAFGARFGGRPRGVGLLGEFAVRPGAKLVPV